MTFYTKSNMSHFLQEKSALLVVLLGACMTTILGCGDGRPTCVPVSSKVLIDGNPLPCGTIRVVPKDGRPAVGIIQPDGSFTLKTFEDGDGVVAGTHPVMIIATERLQGNQQKWHAPKKYATTQTSGLTITVDESGNPVPPLELTWGGGQPFVEILEE